jgi:hypothetical protein
MSDDRFVDCLIVSTALNNTDILVTEDEVIKDLKKNKAFLELKASINPKFDVKTSREALGL